MTCKTQEKIRYHWPQKNLLLGSLKPLVIPIGHDVSFFAPLEHLPGLYNTQITTPSAWKCIYVFSQAWRNLKKLLNLGIIDISCWLILCLRAVLYMDGYLAASLASTCQMPVPSFSVPTPTCGCDNQNCLQILPNWWWEGEGAKLPWLRITPSYWSHFNMCHTSRLNAA